MFGTCTIVVSNPLCAFITSYTGILSFYFNPPTPKRTLLIYIWEFPLRDKSVNTKVLDGALYF